MKCAVSVNSVDLNLLVGTSSDVSLMSLQLFDKYFVSEALEPCPVSITGYTSHKIATVGCFHAKVIYKDNYGSAKFHEVQKCSSLLGKDLIQILGINVQGKTVSCFATNTCTTTVAGKVLNSDDSRGNATSVKGVPSPQTKSTPTVPPKIKSEFPNLFSDKLGKVKGFRHRVKIRSHVKSVQQKLRRLPFTVRDAFSEEAGIIERTDASEWISPIVVAWKKGGQIRVCVDLRKPNEAFIEDKFLPHTVDEMLSEMPGATHFSKLGLKSAYPQLELDPESRDLTAFITHEGVFRFCIVCLGLSSAPSCFQKIDVDHSSGHSRRQMLYR